MTRLRIALPPAPNRTIGATSGLQPVEAPAKIVGDPLMSAMTGVNPTSSRSLAVRGADAAIGTRSPAQRGDMAGGARRGSGPRRSTCTRQSRSSSPRPHGPCQAAPRVFTPDGGTACGAGVLAHVEYGPYHVNFAKPRSTGAPALSNNLRSRGASKRC